MKTFDKQTYKYLKSDAKVDEIYTATYKVSKENRTGFSYNGYTVAFQVASPKEAEPRMLKVAVSYCAPEDKFKKKVGKYNALANMYDGEYVQLPLAEFFSESGIKATKEFILDVFRV
jgi:hypothetical protein